MLLKFKSSPVVPDAELDTSKSASATDLSSKRGIQDNELDDDNDVSNTPTSSTSQRIE